MDIADVVVDIDAPDLQPSYSYQIPEAMQNVLCLGDCVHVPFAGREALGYVIKRRSLSSNDPLRLKLKEIIAIVGDANTINPEQLAIAEWMSEHYVCDLLTAIRCVAPSMLGARVVTTIALENPDQRASAIGAATSQSHLIETLRALNGEAELETFRDAANIPGFHQAYKSLVKKGILRETRVVARAKTVSRKVKGYRLGATAEVLNARGKTSRRSPQQQRILNELVTRARLGTEPVPAEELLRVAEASSASLYGLVEKKLVQVTDLVVRRTPVSVAGMGTEPPPLTPGQARAVETLAQCIASKEMQTVLLFGVTASGKTEVYLNAIAKVLEENRSAIVLLPEIALTAQVVDIFLGRFGEQVAVLHSRLSEGERHDEWRRLQEGKARIVVGARSAVFAPVFDVGLIVVDEEHEASYKQENNPRYNARDLARERARLSRATLVLGSATPSVETYHAARTTASTLKRRAETFAKARSESELPPTTKLIVMPERIDNRPLPRVEVVDLREEFRQRRALFSERLTSAMEERLHKRQQIILFLNRRGYAQFVLCRDCGWAATCPNCAVSLAYHVFERALKCHHCDYTCAAPQICPSCQGAKVKAFGIGTEKIEEEVLKVFPSARVVRMDKDTTAQKGAHTRILRDFRQGDADILIGTQMVAKGLDFPNVTLVGVISADTAINMPDFRAAERTFQLLTQVAGRAGRGQHPGEVIIQTFNPEHYSVQAALHQDYVAFYQREIEFRRELNYPPFSRFANLICADPNEQRAASRARMLAAAVRKVIPQTIDVIGPSPAPLARLKNQFRFHVALRGPLETHFSEMIRSALNCLEPSERQGISIDIDPLNMA